MKRLAKVLALTDNLNFAQKKKDNEVEWYVF